MRLINSMGTSGSIQPQRDFGATIGFGTRSSWRFARYATVGVRQHLLLRNWDEVSRYYGYISDCEAIDTRCDRRADYWSVGWLIAISTAEAGWDIMLRAEGTNEPWISAGTALTLYTDGNGLGAEGANRWIIAHSGTAGVGYDWEVVGIGIRISYANDSILLATSSDQLLTVLFSLDVLLPRDHGDRRKR